MKSKPKSPIVNFCHPLVRGLICIELFFRPTKKRWFNKWRSVVISDIDGKTQVYLDNNPYLFYDHKLSWWKKLRLKFNPFLIMTTKKGSCLINGSVSQVTDIEGRGGA